MAIQHLVPPRQILCLTSWGIHTIIKSRPLDILREVLLSHNQQQINFFKEEYGAVELCAMCLSLACGYVTSFGPASASSLVTDANVRMLATRTFINNAGRPQAQTYTTATQMQRMEEEFERIGGMSMSGVDVQFSNSHNGFAVYLTRLLRPFWGKPILKLKQSTFTVEQFKFMEQLLINLRDYLASSKYCDRILFEKNRCVT